MRELFLACALTITWLLVGFGTMVLVISAVGSDETLNAIQRAFQ